MAIGNAMNQKGLMSSTIFCPNNFGMWLSFCLRRQGLPLWVPVCVSFTGKFSPNFKREKYDFNLYKGFFMGKKKVAQIHQTSNIKKFPNRQSLNITSRR
jgi:hypothetical protein